MLSAYPPKRKGTKVRPSSISISAAMTAPRPMPPYSSGVWTPQNPALRAFSCSSRCSSLVSPRSPARSRRSTSGSSGMNTSLTKLRSRSRMLRSVSDSEKSTYAGFFSHLLTNDVSFAAAYSCPATNRKGHRRGAAVPRPTTPLLSLEAIRQAGLEIIDNEGLERLSMRRLAERLGVRAASLYNHVPTKEHLLHEIADGVMAQVDVSGFEVDWVTGLRSWARSSRAALAAHPNLVPFLASGPARRENALRRADAVHGGL